MRIGIAKDGSGITRGGSGITRGGSGITRGGSGVSVLQKERKSGNQVRNDVITSVEMSIHYYYQCSTIEYWYRDFL